MKILGLILIIITSCAQRSNEDKKINDNDPPDRNHGKCQVERTNTKIVFKCSNSRSEISLSELKGRDGHDGKDGRRGERGPSGRHGSKGDKGDPGEDGKDYEDVEMKWCHHDPNTHIDYTVTLMKSVWIETFAGARSPQGYAGRCHQDHEGKCTCDQCPADSPIAYKYEGRNLILRDIRIHHE